MTTSIDALAGIAAIDAANEAEGGGADSGGWDFNQVSDLTGSPTGSLNNVSVLNVSPTNQSTTQSSITSKTAKSLLYDPTKPATAATSEGLYRNRKAAMKAAGVTYGTQAYKDWDAATRTLMGVGPKDKFSSGAWMSKFGTMDEEEINEEIGNVEYYLNDNLSSASSSSAISSGHAKQARARINPYASNFLGAGKLVSQRPMGTPQVQVVPYAGEFFENYFNKLQADYPSFRVPSPHGGSYQPDDPVSQAIADKFRDERLKALDQQGLISQGLASVEDVHVTHGNEGITFGGAAAAPVNPYARSSTYGSGSPFDFDEQIVAQPGLFDAETADSYNDWLSRISPEEAAWLGLSPAKPGDPYIDPRTLKTFGNIDLVRTGISGGTNPATGLPYKPGETLKQSFLPEGVGGQYWGIASPAQSRTDLIKLAASSGQDILDHEYVHAGMRMVAANTPSWQGKIDFQGQDLFDVLFDKQKNEWDHVAMHIGIYATNNGTMPGWAWDHPILKDINDDESLTLEQKEERMVRRGKQLGLRLNEAAGLVLAGPVSQQNPSNWFNISSTPWFTGASM